MSKKKNKKVKDKEKKELKLKKSDKKKKKKVKQQKKETKAIDSVKKVTQSDVYKTFNRLVSLVNKMSNEPVMFNGNSYHNAELKAIDIISKYQPISTANLANKLKVTRSAVLKTINKLIHKGLIEKQKSKENGRIFEFKLTQEGNDFIVASLDFKTIEEDSVMNALNQMSEKELAYFNDALERILINLIN